MFYLSCAHNNKYSPSNATVSLEHILHSVLRYNCNYGFTLMVTVFVSDLRPLCTMRSTI